MWFSGGIGRSLPAARAYICSAEFPSVFVIEAPKRASYGCSIFGSRRRSFHQFAREWAAYPDIFWPYHQPQLQPNEPVFLRVGVTFICGSATAGGSSDNSWSIKSSHSIFLPMDRTAYNTLLLSLYTRPKKQLAIMSAQLLSQSVPSPHTSCLQCLQC